MRGNADNFYVHFVALDAIDHSILDIEPGGPMPLPFALQRFVAKACDGTESFWPAGIYDILPFLIPLQNLDGNVFELLRQFSMLINFPHVLYSMGIPYSLCKPVPCRASRYAAVTAKEWASCDRFDLRLVGIAPPPYPGRRGWVREALSRDCTQALRLRPFRTLKGRRAFRRSEEDTHRAPASPPFESDP
jgi:hypothetical protein